MEFGEKPFQFKNIPDLFLIKTSRLCLRPIKEEDIPSIFTNFTHTVARYMTPKPASEVSETKSFVSGAIKAFDEKRDLQLVMEKGPEFVGIIGLRSRKGPKTPEIGLWLKEESWGNGYGFESVLGLIEWTRENVSFEEFVYPVDRRNQSSKRIPIRLGAKLVSEYKGIRGWSDDLEIEEYRFR